MDMLYKAERYDDVVNLFPHAQELFKRDSSNIVTLVFAALYQMVCMYKVCSDSSWHSFNMQ